MVMGSPTASPLVEWNILSSTLWSKAFFTAPQLSPFVQVIVSGSGAFRHGSFSEVEVRTSLHSE